MSAESQVEGALRERFRTFEEDPLNLVDGRVEYEGLDPSPIWQGRRWARFHIEWAGAERRTIRGSSGLHEWSGVMFVQLFEPVGDGLGDVMEALERLSDLFVGWSQAIPDVRMDTPYVPRKARVSEDTKDIQLTWRCSFRAYKELVNAS